MALHQAPSPLQMKRSPDSYRERGEILPKHNPACRLPVGRQGRQGLKIIFIFFIDLKKEGTLPTMEKECNSNRFVYQKLDYMHKNPVSKKWQLVNDFTDYLHSSASYCEKGIKQYDKLIHVNEVLL